MENEVKYYSLTHPQKAIWYTEKVYPDTSIGNVAATLRIKGEVDFLLLEKAVNIVIEKNDALRLRIIEEKGEPWQFISEYTYQKLDFFNFSGKEIDELYKWDEGLTTVPFNLTNSNLYYFALIKINNNDGGFFVKFHHLISDGWTMSLLGKQVMEYYSSLKNNIDTKKEKEPSYLEYALSEEDYKKSNRFQKDKEYWNSKLKTVDELTTLKPRTTNNVTTKAKRKSFVTPKKFTQKLYQYCAENKATVFSLFLSALSLYINRITAKEDIIIGTTVLNRSNFKEKNTMGMFISTVPMRLKINDDIDFKTFEENISKEWLTALRHQKYPYDLLLKEVREKNNITDNLYDIVISYQNLKFVKDNYSEESITRWHFNGHQVNSLSIHISDREEEGYLLIEYDFISDLFYAKEIEFIHQHLISLLWHAIDNPVKKVSKIEMISEREKHKILFDFNDTSADYPKYKTIHELFEEQVERTPDNTAVVFEDKQLTYTELNEKANQLAKILREKGVKPDTIVGLMVYRSLEMIIGILGILKAGGAYLPVDPEYPEDRIKYMLEDSGAGILLTQKELVNKVEFKGDKLDLKDAKIYSKDKSNLSNINKSSDLIYVIYTSGSTGKPKGVMIENRNVVRLLFNSKFQFEFNEKDIWTMFHSYCFDFSVWEMYGALLYGGKLVIVPNLISRNSTEFYKLLQEERVTVLNQTPSAFYNLMSEDFKSHDKNFELRYVIFGGEALNPSMLKPFKEKYTLTKLINMYGITETTVHVTFKEIKNEDIENKLSNIGRPIPTLKTYIVDKHMNLVPIGVAGELCVSGDGVARGYLNKSELTAKKFIENPFVPGEKMYRSGDLCRWYSGGDMEYLGRIDHQVKIRGFRIELGEIENQLLKHKNISKAIVIAKEDKNKQKHLIAYIKCDKEISIIDLRAFLTKELPSYMIPSHFIKVEEIPLTTNGKVDRELLFKIEDSLILGNKYTAPTNETEERLIKIWSNVLEVQKVGINDNFFDLGGDSLNAVTIVSKIGDNITLADLYKNPTVKALSDKIRQNKIAENRILVNFNDNNKENTTAIICFPYGGGTPIIYKELSDSIARISKDYSLYSVNLPGHDIGTEVSDFLTLNEVAEEIKNEIQKSIKGDIILYGHCVGSALTIETARLLEKANIEVSAVYIGGIFPPKFARYFGNILDPWKFYSDKNIIKFLNKIGLPELNLKNEEIDHLMKAFRYDVRSYYNYFYDYSRQKNEKLKAPIYSIIGEKDPLTKSKNYKIWYTFSNYVKLLELKEAKHYFIKTHPDELAHILIS